MSRGLHSAQPVRRKPKVVRIIARLNIGGPARQVCALHERLAQSFDTRLVVGGLATGEQDMSYLLSSLSNVIQLPQMSREIALWSDIRAFWRILRFLRRERPDIVHTHTAKAGALGRLAARIAGVPVIIHTYHGHVFKDYFNRFTTRVFLAIERVMGRFSTRVIAVSQSQAQEICLKYKVVPPWKTRVIYNGFGLEGFSRQSRDEARRELGLGAADFVAVWAGRMAPVKDVGLLAQVVRRAAERQSKVRFLIVGDGEDRAELESLVSGHENVELLGWRHDMERVWSAADVALLTSRTEGTPTALIEAMAAGVPFVATRVGAVPDLAVGGMRALPNSEAFEAANGFLTERNEGAILDCIEQLVREPETAVRMGAAGKAFVLEHFPVGRLVREIEQLYTELLGGQSAARGSSHGESGKVSSPKAPGSTWMTDKERERAEPVAAASQKRD